MQTLLFNLHLSTFETSPIVSSSLLSISQDEKKNPTLALDDLREKGLCNTGHDSSKISIVPLSIENIPGCSGRQTPLINSGKENTLEGSNHKCVDCDDICDALELSVAASEALVIHKASQIESCSDALSMSAILEAALQVKQARLVGKKESSCCFKECGDTADTISDLGDSDMEDAYNDVGLDIHISDNDAVNSNVRHRKTVSYFIKETSYLSESVDIFPDQNSVVHNCQRSSNASESNKPFDDSYKVASEGGFVSQEVVKSSSYVDPLCSVVPCSISAEIGDSIRPDNIYNDQALDALKSLPLGREFLMENSQTRSGDKNDNAGREEHNDVDLDKVGLVIQRKFTSLRTYSTGPPSVSFKKNFNCGIVTFGENEAREISDSTKFRNDKATTDQQPVQSTNCPAAKNLQKDKEIDQLSVEQCQSCTNTLKKQVSDKLPPVNSVFSCTAATNNMDNHGDYAFGGLVQESYGNNDDNGAEQQVCCKDIPTSPVVLCHRTKRFKAPKRPASDVASDKKLIDQGPDLETHCDTKKNFEGEFCNLLKSDIPARKRVRFTDDSKPQDLERKRLRRIPTNKCRSSHRLGTRSEICHREQGTASQEVKERLTKCRLKDGKKLIFQGLEFLLTGFSKNKQKEIEGLLRKHGGMVLSDIPALLLHPKKRALKFNAEKLPVVLCTKKLQTTRFLYGCAVNAFMLKVGWAYNSIRVGSVLPPDKYLILSRQINGMANQIGRSICQLDNYDHIFEKTGIMLHGMHSFCNKMTKVIKYGQGHVYKSLQWLVQSLEKKKISLAVIVVEDEHHAPRHLKKCASEQSITVMPARWVTNSLYEGKLLPLMENNHPPNPRVTSVSEVYNPEDWSQEI